MGTVVVVTMLSECDTRPHRGRYDVEFDWQCRGFGCYGWSVDDVEANISVTTVKVDVDLSPILCVCDKRRDAYWLTLVH